VLLVLAAFLAAPGPAHAGETPKKPGFSREKLSGKAGETIWYRFQAKNPKDKGNEHYHVIALVQRVLKRYGLDAGKHYWLDRSDDLGLLAITGDRKWTKLIRSLLGFLEEEQPQVRIQARIVETLTRRDLQAGVDSSIERKSSKDTFFRGFSIDHQPQAYLDSILHKTIPYTGSSVGFGTVDTVDAQGNFVSKTRERVGAVSLALRALGEHQTSNILAEPDQMVLSGGTAEFRVKKSFPIQNVQITGSTTKVTIKEKDLGTFMTVVPHIVGKDRVYLKIDVKVENQAGFVEVGPGTKYPFTSLRQVKTSVTVRSGYEVVIGGLFQKEYSVVEKGVPLLSEIPLVGYLFKSYWRTKSRKELLFFIKPRIIKPRARLLSPAGD
jgi:type II secretory pathway component GspD/PulD (secretin)